jgi:acetolactate synthase-1/2/3 large subunit
MPGGGHNLDLIGAAEDAGIEFVLMHGETAAALAAAAYAESSGNLGACVVTRGPGAASVVNGVAHALFERVPLIVITEAIPPAEAARNSHQLIDQATLFAPVTKWSLRLGADTALPAAIEVALRPPAGPVHLDFMPGLDEPAPAPPRGPSRAGDRERAEALIAGARSPVVVVGVGARRAGDAVSAALARLSCPVLPTYKAKGLLPESSPAAAGLLTGATIEAPLLSAADVIVAVGFDPVEMIPGSWPYEAPVVSLAEWPTESSYARPAVELVVPLEETIGLLQPLEAIQPEREPREHLVATLAALDIPADGLAPYELVREARAAFLPGTIATVDSGAHMIVAMAYWLVERPGEVLISSGFATMGFALPGAVGAAVATGRRVVCFTGDGGLGMALAELETLARLRLPVTVVVFDDAALSLIEVKQGEGQGGKRAVRFAPIDFGAVARGLGCEATRVATLEELRGALAVAAAAEGPYLIDAVVDASRYREVVDAVRGGSR